MGGYLKNFLALFAPKFSLFFTSKKFFVDPSVEIEIK